MQTRVPSCHVSCYRFERANRIVFNNIHLALNSPLHCADRSQTMFSIKSDPSAGQFLVKTKTSVRVLIQQVSGDFQEKLSSCRAISPCFFFKAISTMTLHKQMCADAQVYHGCDKKIYTHPFQILAEIK